MYLSGPPAENDGEKEEASVASRESTFTEIAVSIENGVYTIKKNRPHKKNAITWKVYRGGGRFAPKTQAFYRALSFLQLFHNFYCSTTLLGEMIFCLGNLYI